MKRDAAIKQLQWQMSGISEEYYCAGWMQHLEYSLWDAMKHDNRRYGLGIITQDEVNALEELSKDAECWLYWDTTTNEVTPIAFDEWETMFAIWKHRNA